MQPNTSDNQYSEQTLRQIALDARRALVRARYCIERSQVDRFRCVDDQPETDAAYGRQLWYFEGTGVDDSDRRHRIYGAVEYSLQYGLHEVVEDGVFGSPEQRDRFRVVYRGGLRMPRWRDPLHRLLLVVLMFAPLMFVAHMLLQWAGQ